MRQTKIPVSVPLETVRFRCDAAVTDKIDKVGLVEEAAKMRAAGIVVGAVVTLIVANFPAQVS